MGAPPAMFKREAGEFNSYLLDLCQVRKGAFYVSHAVNRFALCAVPSADGLHPSFAGVYLLAWDFYNLLLDLRRPYIIDWQDHAPQPALERDHRCDACRSDDENNANKIHEPVDLVGTIFTERATGYACTTPVDAGL
ncbi:hypothetical protein HPB52_021324 [Rhipicephalus sanguineus]|uniref:Uncharacterized protein n=1 Tax=Rhipicephalus sanguineus TaxID=34632 RepID=A0A9D4PF53_RHISA|nr:hypothetical protein HPB52_021324 [Rhipicephalus sanguineus]